MDAATRLIALQGERDYVLFRMRDLDNNDTGLHPTMEKRQLMNLFEVLNSKIRELTNEVLHDDDDELGFVVENGKVEEIIECRYTDGVFRNKETGEIVQCSRVHDGQEAVIIFMKEQDNESET